MQKIKEFWVNSYTTDQTAFYFELVSFIFTVGASLTLAVNAKDPNMLICTLDSLSVVSHSVMQQCAEVQRG